MGKRSDIKELITLLSLALTHKIGGLVNPGEIYSEKYQKESNAFLKKAIKVSLRQNWNKEDKINIRDLLKKKLKSDLEKRDFLNDKKFDLMEREINNALKSLSLN